MIDAADIPEILAQVDAGQRCTYCWGEFDQEHSATSRTVDHVIPVVLGGGNNPENLTWACRSCNSAKGAGHPVRFYEDRLNWRKFNAFIAMFNVLADPS